MSKTFFTFKCKHKLYVCHSSLFMFQYKSNEIKMFGLFLKKKVQTLFTVLYLSKSILNDQNVSLLNHSYEMKRNFILQFLLNNFFILNCKLID